MDKTDESQDENQLDAKPIEQQIDLQPTTSHDALALAQSIDIGRSYSPIIEDPRERDSRPASTDPIEDRKGSIPPNLMDHTASIPSRSATPVLEPTRAASATAVKTDTAEAPADVTPAKASLTADAQQSSSSSRQTTPEPIFRPLIVEKGKSKTTGKNIGGWI